MAADALEFVSRKGGPDLPDRDRHGGGSGSAPD